MRWQSRELKKSRIKEKEACFLGQGTNLAYSEWTSTYVNDCHKCNREKMRQREKEWEWRQYIESFKQSKNNFSCT